MLTQLCSCIPAPLSRITLIAGLMAKVVGQGLVLGSAAETILSESALASERGERVEVSRDDEMPKPVLPIAVGDSEASASSSATRKQHAAVKPDRQTTIVLSSSIIKTKSVTTTVPVKPSSTTTSPSEPPPAALIEPPPQSPPAAPDESPEERYSEDTAAKGKTANHKPADLYGGSGLKIKGGKIVPLPGRIYQGAFADFGGTEDKVTLAAIRNWEDKIGRKLGIVTFSLNWGKSISYPRNALAIIHKHGATSLVRLMPRADFAKPKAGVVPKFNLASIVAGEWDQQLRMLAMNFKIFDVPVFMDFAPEMNGTWFHWGGKWNGGASTTGYGDPKLADGPELFRDAYRHIINIFRKVGANKVTWIFHVDSYDIDSKGYNAIRNYYPGSDYIDWLGLSFYGAHESDQRMIPFDGIMAKAYRSLTDLDASKPIFLSEFGASELANDPLAKAKWIKAAGQTIVSQKFSNIKAISYWHENYQSPNRQPALLRLDSSLPALSMYRIFIGNDVFYP